MRCTYGLKSKWLILSIGVVSALKFLHSSLAEMAQVLCELWFDFGDGVLSTRDCYHGSTK
jgi:hypothetical protein